jgi:hypothetical protein
MLLNTLPPANPDWEQYISLMQCIRKGFDKRCFSYSSLACDKSNLTRAGFGLLEPAV